MIWWGATRLSSAHARRDAGNLHAPLSGTQLPTIIVGTSSITITVIIILCIISIIISVIMFISISSSTSGGLKFCAIRSQGRRPKEKTNAHGPG